MRILFVVLHFLFWTGLFQLFYWVHIHFISEEDAFSKGLFSFLIFAGVFYLHSLILVNLFLEKRKYLLYSAGALILIIIATWLRHMIDTALPDSQLPFQLFLSKERPLAAPILITLFWMCFSLIYQLLVNRVNREKKHLIRLSEFTITQNQLLKSQINPHFLFNNLNNLYSLIETNSPNASQVVLKLAEILRYTVYKSTNEHVSLNEELEQVKNLIEIYQLKENGTLTIRIDELENKEEILVEPMLLIPLVENCFKHGNCTYEENGFIFIRVQSTKSGCLIEITNSTSTKHQKHNEVGGVGLRNLRQRIHLIYGNKSNLVTELQNNVFKATLTISWNEK